MNDRSQTISELLQDSDFRADYVRAKLAILLPSQVRALRADWTQQQLASAAGMKQSRISAIETPGATNFNLDTLVRLASAFEVGLKVEFVPYSEMLEWENRFSQDLFTVTPLRKDESFLNGDSTAVHEDMTSEGLRSALQGDDSSSRNIARPSEQKKDVQGGRFGSIAS